MFRESASLPETWRAVADARVSDCIGAPAMDVSRYLPPMGGGGAGGGDTAGAGAGVAGC